MADPVLPAHHVAFMGEWTFINVTTPPPANAQLRLNDGGQNKATAIYVSNITFNGIDASAWLMEMTPGYVIRIQDKIDPTKWQSYSITGAPVANAGYVELKTNWLAGGTNLAQTAVILSVVSSVVRPTGMAVTVGIGAVAAASHIRVNVDGLQMQAHVGSPLIRLGSRVEVTGEELRIVHGVPAIAGHVHLPSQAFPSDTPIGFSAGMTLRQYYAAQAMMGFISAGQPAANLVGRLAQYSFQVADSMIAYEQKEAAGIVAPPVGGDRDARAVPPVAVAPISVVPPSVPGQQQMPPASQTMKAVWPRKVIT